MENLAVGKSKDSFYLEAHNDLTYIPGHQSDFFSAVCATLFQAL